MNANETFRLADMLGTDFIRNAYASNSEMYDALLHLSSATFVTNKIVGNYDESTIHEMLQDLFKALKLQKEEWEELQQEVQNLSHKTATEIHEGLSHAIMEWADIQVYQFHMLNILTALAKLGGDRLKVPDSVSAVARNNMKKMFTNRAAAEAVQEQYTAINVPTKLITKNLGTYGTDQIFMIAVAQDCYSSAGRYYPENKFLKPLKPLTAVTPA